MCEPSVSNYPVVLVVLISTALICELETQMLNPEEFYEHKQEDHQEKAED